jgi:AraC family transcriptional regulator, L-rhamnose operon transcriptional activator RhaR
MLRRAGVGEHGVLVESPVVFGGEGRHVSPLGTQELSVGYVALLKPGAWHALEECRDLEVINCCFNAELLRREVVWPEAIRSR